MSPTSDERREVAERLRWLASKQGTYKGVLGSDVLVPLGLLSVDYLGFMTRKSVTRLADLIDPTCKLRFDSVHQDFVCTHCGAWFDGFQTYDGHGKWNDMRYCPNCGARVVSGHE